MISGAEGDVHRVELGRLDRARRIPVGMKATAIAAGAGALWVASEETDTVTRLDPRTGAVVAPVTVGHAPSALAVGEGAVWVVNRADGTLSRIDPDTNAVSWSVGVGRDPTAVAVGEGAVWVAGGEEGTVARVDPDGPRKAQRFKVGSSPSALAVAGGSVWTAAVAPAAGAPGRNAAGGHPADGPDKGPVPVNWLHEDGYYVYTWLLVGLAHDGLVAYRRVPGVAGGTLVGGLATRPPAAEPGRAHLRLHPATRHPLLRRDAGQAGRFPRVDGALPAHQPRLGIPPDTSTASSAHGAASARRRAATSRAASSRMRTRGRSPST